MTENSKKPRIRFKGFTDTWEQRKLGEVGKAQSGIGFPDKEQGGKQGIPFFKVSDMNLYGNEREMTVANNYVTESQIEKNNWKPIEETSMLFAKVGAAIMLNRKRLVRFSFLLDNNTMAFKFGDSWDIDFGVALFNRFDLTSLVQVGALPSYNATDIENIEISMPNKEEQHKIGAVLAEIDNLITLHQCKLFILFSDYGFDYFFIQDWKPYITWEQRKLGELGEFKSNGVDKLSKPDEIPVNLLNYMDIYNRREINANNCSELMRVTAKLTQIKDNNVQENDVFFTPTSETADDIGHAMVIEETLENTVYSYHLMRFRPQQGAFYKTYPNYGCAVQAVRQQMALMAQGVQRFVLSKGQFESIEIPYPNVEEQEKISLLLGKIENLITLHQRGG